jgi:hypothetical protein
MSGDVRNKQLDGIGSDINDGAARRFHGGASYDRPSVSVN